MMKAIIEIKGKKIGQGRPLVCIPIMEATEEKILKEAERLEKLEAEMIEWRVDVFEDCCEPKRVESILEKLKHIIHNSIFIFTFRSHKEGGNCVVSDDILEQLQLTGAKAEVVDFVDVEFFSVPMIEERITQIHNYHTFVITSYHNFESTPSETELREIFRVMQEKDGDIIKVAVMPSKKEDVARLMSETMHFHESHPDTPLITMSMGREGAISRVLGEFTGSSVTFGAGLIASAPGQIEMRELCGVLDALHKNCF